MATGRKEVPSKREHPKDFDMPEVTGKKRLEQKGMELRDQHLWEGGGSDSARWRQTLLRGWASFSCVQAVQGRLCGSQFRGAVRDGMDGTARLGGPSSSGSHLTDNQETATPALSLHSPLHTGQDPSQGLLPPTGTTSPNLD